MFTFVLEAARSHVSLFVLFFTYLWAMWTLKAALARRYRPTPSVPQRAWRTTVIAPVYREPEPLFRRVLASVVANRPTELIVVVDGGDERLVAVAEEYADRVLAIPKAGKRVAIRAGLTASDPTTDIVLVLDSDTIWAPGALDELLAPFADPKVGGVTPRQAIFDRDANRVRRLADWIEDLRYGLTVPAQSTRGAVGCLAGRTIAYRREAFEPAVDALVAQRVLGVPQHIGDDRVLTNELLRRGWRTVYQSSAVVWTDAPNDWRTFWRQQLRWGRSSQRETLLSLRWLWRRPLTLACFAHDIVIPFALWALAVSAVTGMLAGREALLPGVPIVAQLALAYVGMLVGIGVRQVPHFRRHPGDLRHFPLFVLQLTFLMAPVRLAAFATMFHQSWATRTTDPNTTTNKEDQNATTAVVPEPALG